MIKINIWSENEEKSIEVFIPDKIVKPFYMVGRIVFLYEIDKFTFNNKEKSIIKCTDCGEEAKYIVIDNGYNWLWCGYCNVGM